MAVLLNFDGLVLVPDWPCSQLGAFRRDWAFKKPLALILIERQQFPKRPYRAVIFVWADQLPFAQSSDTEQDRKLFYVALTRATELLAIVHSGESTFVKETYTAVNKTRSHWLTALLKVAAVTRPNRANAL